MKKEDFTFASANGERALHGICWMPDAPKAVVQIVHGMAEYVDRYDDFATFLADHGFAVYGHDHAGHGGSALDAQDKGFFYASEGWQNVVEDIRALHQRIRADFPTLPVILLGHSMGSFLSRWYITLYGEDLAGVVLMGTMGPNPAAGMGRLVARFEKWRLGPKGRSKLLDRMMFGSYAKAYTDPRTAFDWISSDPQVVDAYIADEDCGFVFTTAAIGDLLEGVQRISSKEWPGLVPKTLPILLISGEQDPVGGMGGGVRKVHGTLQEAGARVDLVLYPEGRHEILNERNRQEVYQALLTWMNEACLSPQ